MKPICTVFSVACACHSRPPHRLSSTHTLGLIQFPLLPKATRVIPSALPSNTMGAKGCRYTGRGVLLGYRSPCRRYWGRLRSHTTYFPPHWCHGYRHTSDCSSSWVPVGTSTVTGVEGRGRDQQELPWQPSHQERPIHHSSPSLDASPDSASSRSAFPVFP